MTENQEADRWLQTLRHSQQSLAAVVEPLDEDALRAPSFDREWSIAQVLSHLGSGAEIFGLLLEAGLAGRDAPGRDRFGPIWEAWNARGPEAQASECLRSDAAFVARLDSLGEAERAAFHLAAWGMEIDFARLLQMRLNEHALHSWDVAVALDPAATVAADAVALLVGGVGQLASRAGKPDGADRLVIVTTTEPERRFVLETTGDAVSLSASDETSGTAELSLPAEALVRLVSGRLDAAHTPAVHVQGVDLEELRPLFPGF